MDSPSESQQVAEFRAAASLLIERIQWMRQHGITFKGDRDLYEVLGYDRVLEPKDYRDRFARGGIAGRVVEALPNATWRGGVELIEDEDPENETPFEKAWADLDKRLKIVPMLRRADILAGQGRYAILLIGAPGELNTELPNGRPEKLLYLTPFAEDDATITKWELDTENPRFGLPSEYMLRRMDITSMAFTKPVHWSRCIHIAEGCLDNDVFGLPALERIWNLLDDLEKVTGGGAEAFWLRANQGLQIDIDKDMELSEPARQALASEVEQYRNNISRVMKTRGTTVNTLGSDTANFSNPADSILTQIAGSKSIPKRILTGSEMGELASSQDRDNWKDQVNGRQTGYAGPFIVRPLVDRLIEYGYLPKPGAQSLVKKPKPGEELPVDEKTPAEKLKPGEEKPKPGEEEAETDDKKKAPPFVKAAAAKIKLVNDKEIETARPLTDRERGLSPENRRAYEEEQTAAGVKIGIPTKDDPLSEDGTVDNESVESKNADADYEVRWAHMQTLTEQEKSEGAKNWASTTSGEGPVFTRSEIRDKWYQLPPLTEEQLLEMEASKPQQSVPLLDENGQPVLDEFGQPAAMPPGIGAPGGGDITSVLDQLLGDVDPEADDEDEEEDAGKKPPFPFKAAGGEGSGVVGHRGAIVPSFGDRARVPIPGTPKLGRSFAHPTPQAAQATVKKAASHLRKKGFKIGPSLAGSAGVTITPFSLGKVAGQIRSDGANNVSVSLKPAIGKIKSAAQMLVDGMNIKVGEPEPEVKRKYSSTQVNLPAALADKILAIGNKIPDADLGEDGREDRPHVTVKYGLHTNDPLDVERLLTNATPIELTLGPLAVFQHDDYDVLFATVYSPYMRELNALISSRLQVTDTHSFYSPHATIAYLRPGLGKRYVNDPELNILNGERVIIDEVIFLDVDKKFTPIRLRGELKAAEEAEPEEVELSAEELGVVEYLEHMFTEVGAEWSLVPREDGKFDVLLARPEPAAAPEPPPAPIINVHPPNIVIHQPEIQLTVPINPTKPSVKTFEYGMVDGRMRPVVVKDQDTSSVKTVEYGLVDGRMRPIGVKEQEPEGE